MNAEVMNAQCLGNTNKHLRHKNINIKYNIKNILENI